jgi:uncharacterized protein YvpB
MTRPGPFNFTVKGIVVFEMGRSFTKFEDVCDCISKGTPVVIGTNFIDGAWDKNGKVDMNGTKILGSHAVLVYGFTEDQLLFVNSWGGHWGQKGRGRMSKAYFEEYGVKAVFFRGSK